MPRISLAVRTALPMRDLLEFARAAEVQGYESFWTPDSPERDTFTEIASAALATERIKVGTGVAPIYYRTPTITAIMAASIDELSGQRFILGIGSGHRNSVEQHHGVPFDRRFLRLREYVSILRQVFTGDEVNFQGKAYQIQGYRLDLRPLRANLPIYLAALGPQMLQLAGEIGDGVILNWMTVDQIPWAIEQIRIGAERGGKSLNELEIISYIRTCVSGDFEAIKPVFGRMFAQYMSSPFYNQLGPRGRFTREIDLISGAWMGGRREEAISLVTEELLTEFCIWGTAESCQAQLDAFRAAGLTTPAIYPLGVGDDPKASILQTIQAFRGDRV
ncbi:MAG: LLM class flavin-dependent oxidoreductase [Candidatus Tectomicrobia bacterium]|nr:LLM class flavin-dependent oxidoreductase [Candidatus Tectomicrobia bacterium]